MVAETLAAELLLTQTSSLEKDTPGAVEHDYAFG